VGRGEGYFYGFAGRILHSSFSLLHLACDAVVRHRATINHTTQQMSIHIMQLFANYIERTRIGFSNSHETVANLGVLVTIGPL
jgi:hypothetical protein